MPINYSKYPENWKTEIRPRILKRANDKCECCGLQNKDYVLSLKENGKTVWKDLHLEIDNSKVVKVVLTIAHLDHDETNHEVKDDRLWQCVNYAIYGTIQKKRSDERRKRNKKVEQPDEKTHHFKFCVFSVLWNYELKINQLKLKLKAKFGKFQHNLSL